MYRLSAVIKIKVNRKNLAIFFILSFSLAFLFPHPSLAASLPTEKQFTGHVFDQSSDLYYMRARYYDPVIGRFLSPDIESDPTTGGNRYLYTNNNPLNLVDPTGNQPVKDPTYEQWVFKNFPWALEQFWPIEFKEQLIYNLHFSAGLGSQRYLDILSQEFIQKNPNDPLTQRKEFVRYLSRDIRETFHYNPDISMTVNSRAMAREELEGVFSSPLNAVKGVRRGAEYAVAFFYEKLIAEPKTYLRPFSERFREESPSPMCFDYAALTGYVLARAGIPSAMGVFPHYGGTLRSHGFIVVKIGDEFYRIETTLYGGGYLTPFEEEDYDIWEFFTPWPEEFEEFPLLNISNQ